MSHNAHDDDPVPSAEEVPFARAVDEVTTGTGSVAVGLGDAAATKRHGALTALGVLALFAVAVWLGPTRPVALTILALLGVVTIHEAGHFLASRSCRVYTPEFAVGLGPVLASGTRKGMTWSLRAVPLGGFVKIAGMSNTAADSDDGSDIPDGMRSWNDVRWFQRAFIALAGPLANFALAVVLLVAVVHTIGIADPHDTRIRVLPDSAAQAAGIQTGDSIVAIAGQPVDSFKSVTGTMSALSKAGAPGPVEVTLSRDGAERVVTVTPTAENGRYLLGVATDPQRRTPGPGETLSNAVVASKELSIATVSGLSKLGSAVAELPSQVAGTSDDPNSRLVSPVGAAQIATQSVSRDGWFGPFALIAASSMFIGAFNLLPFPPLDGSHVLIAVYEGVASRVRRRQVRVDTNRFAPVVRFVVLLLATVGIATLLLDILRPVHLP